MNAPLPLDQLAFQLKRLDRWKPGAIGRYAAVYARHEDVRDGLIATAYLDGVAVPVRFPSPQLRRRQTRLLAVIAAVTAISTFLAIATTASVLSARAEAAARIAALESDVAVRLRQLRAAENASARMRALANAGLDGRRGTAVVADMDWAAAARSPNARIEAFHRDGTLIAVEVRGEDAPFTGTGRTVQRSTKPLRRGVWLWGSDGGRQVDGGQP